MSHTSRLSHLAVALVLAAFLLETGCSLISGKVGVLWTNRPEFTAYAELFNASQNRFRIEVVYKADPVLSLATEQSVPDLVVGYRENAVPTVRRFISLDQIVNRAGVNPTLFYADLLREGRYDGRQVLLPISFDLPTLLSQATAASPAGQDTTITLAQVRERALSFDKGSTESHRVLAFSPRWRGGFLYLTAQMMGADFHQSSRGQLVWDEPKLASAVSYLQSWIGQVDGGAENDADFQEKYLYDPVDRLLASGRVAYYYMPLSAFATLSPTARSAIRPQWVAEDGHIPVLDDILFFGIPHWARNRAAAFAFLEWFYRPQTQRLLLETAQSEHLNVFGIANGLSALSEVNEQDFPRSYPFLIGRVPKEALLSFPKPLPPDWQGVRNEVVIPWLDHEALTPTSESTLQDRLKSWRLQRPLM